MKPRTASQDVTWTSGFNRSRPSTSWDPIKSETLEQSQSDNSSKPERQPPSYASDKAKLQRLLSLERQPCGASAHPAPIGRAGKLETGALSQDKESQEYCQAQKRIKEDTWNRSTSNEGGGKRPAKFTEPTTSAKR